MKSSSNLSRARSHIVFILGLLVASGIILLVESSDYATLGARGREGSKDPGSWTLRVGHIPKAAQAREICRAARAQNISCIAIPPNGQSS